MFHCTTLNIKAGFACKWIDHNRLCMMSASAPLVICPLWRTKSKCRDSNWWRIGAGLWVYSDNTNSESVECTRLESRNSVVSSGWVNVLNGSRNEVAKLLVILNLKAPYRVSPITRWLRPTNSDACALCIDFKWPTRSGWGSWNF